MAINKNFIVRNGLEVGENLILADSDLYKVGIGTTNIVSTLTVNGDISGIGASFSGIITATQFNGNLESSDISSINLNVSGISTFNNIKIDGLITAGSSEGVDGQYLRRTGYGVTWSSTSALFQSITQTAVESQKIFNVEYSIGLLEVYLNGVRLSSSEFTATNGETIVLKDGAFEGDTLDFVTYSVLTDFSPNSLSSYWSLGDVGIHTLSNVGIGTTIAASTLTVSGNVEVSGIVTATQGFISVGNTTPIQISLSGNELIFTAVGIGSTTLLLS